MPEPSVSASYAQALLDFGVAQGADAHALLARSNISGDDLLDPDNRIAFVKFKALMRSAKELCADPAFALHFGADPALYETSLVGLIIRSAETMGEAFAQYGRFARLVIEVDEHESGDRHVIVRTNGEIWLEDRRANPNDFPELTESTLARMICDYARLFPDRPPFVKAIEVTHAAPAYRAEYDRVLKAPVTFACNRNAMLIDEKWLTTKMPPANRYAFGIFSAHAEALLKELESAKTTRGRVESLLMPILHTGDVSMDTTADKMGSSRQTLYRSLKAEGVTFEQILDELRHKLALHYLSGKKVSVNETAYLVGFSDPAAFSRAFKRWTGASPRAARTKA